MFQGCLAPVVESLRFILKIIGWTCTGFAAFLVSTQKDHQPIKVASWDNINFVNSKIFRKCFYLLEEMYFLYTDD